MLLNSPEFPVAFLPAFLLLYFAVRGRTKNGALFLASLAFYFTTSGGLTVILILWVLSNFYRPLFLERTAGPRKRLYFSKGVLVAKLPY